MNRKTVYKIVKRGECEFMGLHVTGERVKLREVKENDLPSFSNNKQTKWPLTRWNSITSNRVIQK